MRDGESQDVPVKFILTLYKLEKLNNSPDRESHAVSILPVCDIKCCSTAFYFARQEREVHIVRGHKERHIHNIAQNGFYFGQLFFRERGSLESHSIVGLRTRPKEGDRIILTFVNTFN